MNNFNPSLYDYCMENKDKMYLLEEFDYEKNNVKPKEITIGSGKKLWWKCKENHLFEKNIPNRLREQNCPYCNGYKVLKGFNDLATTHPKLLKEWDYTKNNIQPDEVSYGSAKIVWWVCSKGHSYDMSISNKVNGQSCPYCIGRRVLAGFNDLPTTHPHLIKEWDFEKNTVKPEEIYSGSSIKIWWLCSERHSYDTTIRNRLLGNNCPYCSNTIGVNPHSFYYKLVLY